MEQIRIRVASFGISQVQMQLSYVLTGATYYWDGTQVKFSSSPVTTWNNSGTAAWNYENFSGNDIDWPVDMSHLFTLQVRGIDSATQADGAGTGNTGATTTETFVVDFIAPTGAITLPATNSFTNSLSLITGTASDDLSGVESVQLTISSGTGVSQVWWNGSTWQGSVFPLSTTLYSSSWTYASPTWATGKQYFLQAVVMDNAGNTFTTAGSTFTYYNTAPTVTISTPINSNFYSAVQVSTPFGGTATSLPPNAPGISTVTLTLEDLTSVTYFNGTTFVGSVSTVAAQGAVNAWTYNNANVAFTGDHRYTFIAKALDNAGNSGTSSTIQFYYDIQAPTTTITSPASGFTHTWASISGTASDKVGAPTYPSGVVSTGVQVAVESLASSKWWSGTDLAFDCGQSRTTAISR